MLATALTFGLVALLAAAIIQPWATPQPAPSTAQDPGPYIYDMAYVLDTEASRPRDGDGIIMVRYPSGVEYNPVTIAQSALAHYDRWLRQRATADRDEFMHDANWLVDHQADDGLWYFDFPDGSMPVPWVSAMAQGQAISVLVRAYTMTGQRQYYDAAVRALATYDKPSGQGGVSSTDAGYTYYEETMPPYSPHILNGMVFAMYGALDMARAFHDPHGQAIFDAGVRTLAANIDRYDAGNWSYYNQAKPPGLASRFYNGLHVQLLHELFQITGQQIFQTYSNRFAAYASSPPASVTK